MTASAAGPATTDRSSVTEPPKSSPPQLITQPIAIRVTAAAAIAHAGRYTRDARAAAEVDATDERCSTLSRTGATADMARPAGVKTGSERNAARAGVAPTLVVALRRLHRRDVPGSIATRQPLAVRLVGLVGREHEQRKAVLGDLAAGHDAEPLHALPRGRL